MKKEIAYSFFNTAAVCLIVYCTWELPIEEYMGVLFGTLVYGITFYRGRQLK